MTSARLARLAVLRQAEAALRSTGHAADARFAADLADLGNGLEDGLRRDLAIVDLAACFDGPRWIVAGQAADELRRYAGSDWKRLRRHPAAPAPKAYDSQPHKLACLRALRASGGKIVAQKQIDRILATYCPNWILDGQARALSMSTPFLDTANRKPNEAPLLDAILSADHEFLGELRRAPLGKQIATDAAERRLAERKQIAAKLAELDARDAADYPRRTKAVDDAVAAAKAAEVAWRLAQDKARAASAAASDASHGYVLRRASLEQELRGSADNEAIDGFVRDMRAGEEEARREHVGGYVQLVHKETGERILRGFTNKHDVARRIAAIRAAIEEAERLRLSPDQRRVHVRLAELRAALPAIGPAVYAPLPAPRS